MFILITSRILILLSFVLGIVLETEVSVTPPQLKLTSTALPTDPQLNVRVVLCLTAFHEVISCLTAVTDLLFIRFTASERTVDSSTFY